MLVGLTGGIGSGKSTVAKIFRQLGVPVYDSDSQAKELMVSSPGLKTAIIELLGAEAYQEGILDRTYVASRVFKDRELLQKLNALVHPAVREHFLQWAHAQDAAYVIQETALIFESNEQDRYDHTILVTAPRELRLERVIKRDGTDPDAVRDRMDNQMEDDLKIGLASFCIENLDLDATAEQVRELHSRLLALAAKF